ncbi:MAG: O-succinylhomoserine sulfhydrylase [Sphingomonadales bacterium]
MSGDPETWRLRTRLVRGGTARSEFGETSEAIFATSGFVYDRAETAAARFAGDEDGYTYSRLANPTVAMFEDRMALIEGAQVGRATATGMAAVNAALLAQLKAGDHVVSSKALFGSCGYIVEELLPRYGIEVTMVNGSDNDAWEQAVRPDTKLVFLETPSNPALDIIDVRHVAEVAHAAKACVVIDNVFATPVLQKPMELGADVVVYSATKHIDGQGRALGGCILCGQEMFGVHYNQFLRHTGPTMSPFNAWIMLKGLETLDLRVRQMCANAADLADFLAGRGGIDRVIYPGRKDHPKHELAMSQMSLGGSVVTFQVPGGRARAFEIMNALKIIDISNNLGDAKSLITHPASTTHQRLSEDAREELGITEGTIRLSAGLEDIEDLKDDLAQALA